MISPSSFLAQFTTLGPSSCGGDKSTCHATEFKNQVDKHKNSLDDMTSDDAKKYAENSGVGAANILKGNSKCMSCHATALANKGEAEVEDGVSCEGCHGPGSGYRDSHKDVPKDKGGYDNAVKAGMTDLRKLDVRAETCVRCHLTTDQKILASGHPSGLKFKYANQMKSIAKHWKRPLADNDKDQKPFDVAVKVRGPVAEVSPPPASARTPAPETNEENRDQDPGVKTRAPTASRPQPILSVPIPSNTITTPVSVGQIALDPFPQLSDSASVDSILLVVKKRLEFLYQKTNPASKK
ncbi:MAG TPA: multiheme c-type cytochrome [Bacteroidota bacterium]|nr:multiheme c-type cytochrome [Bacteroidota bacterium]